MRIIAVVGSLATLVACAGSNGGATSTTGTTGLFGTLSTQGGGTGSTSTGSTGSTTAGTSGTTSPTGTTGSAGTTSGGGNVAAHASLPQVVTLGGPVMATPNLVPLIYQDDPNRSSLTSFFQTLTTEGTFQASLAQYGVTAITLQPIVPQTATIPSTLTDAEIRTDLKNFVIANPSISDTTLANTLFVVVVPSATTFMLSEGGSTEDLCTALGGYHSFVTTADGTAIVYAVSAECDALPPPYPSSPVDTATVFLTHEIAEAATDGQFYDLDTSDGAGMHPAYVYTSDLSWFLVLGQGELADLCGFPFTYFRDSAGFLEQHIWSNTAAAAGQDPCGGTPYFGVAPGPNVLQPITISGLATTSPINGVTIGVGQTMTIPLVFFSDGPHPPWVVEAIDSAEYHGLSPNTSTSISLTDGENGTTASLTVRVNTSGTMGSYTGLEGVVLYAFAPDGGGGSTWPILIQSP